jgi:hypothetical protein
MNARVARGSALLLVAVPVALGFAACSGKSGGPGKNVTTGDNAQGSGCALQSCGPGLVVDESSCSCLPPNSVGGSGGGGSGAGGSGGGSGGGSPDGSGGNSNRLPDGGCVSVMQCAQGAHWDSTTCECALNGSSSDGGCGFGVMPCVPGEHWDETACQCASDSDASNGCIFANGLACAPGEHWDSTQCQCVSNDEDAGAGEDAAPAEAGCVQNVLCTQGFHWDSTACMCVPPADAGSLDATLPQPPEAGPLPLPEASTLPDAGPPPLPDASPPPAHDAGAGGPIYPEAGPLPYPEAGPLSYPDAGGPPRPDAGPLVDAGVHADAHLSFP